MNDTCDILRPNVPGIVSAWARAADAEPWQSIPTDQLIDHLPPLLNAVVEAAICHAGDERWLHRAFLLGYHRGALEDQRFADAMSELQAESEMLRGFGP